MKENDYRFKKSEKVLSILIPAYNYFDGIVRILNNFSDVDDILKSKFEIIIFDNSNDDSISKELNKYKDFSQMVNYKHSLPTMGACGNWNELIDEANGRYYILMHHDEFPVVDGFIEKVINELTRQPEVDLILMDCLLMDKGKRLFRRHVPSIMRLLVMEYFPAYLFRRNVIGPTASLIVKKELHTKFDCNLTWLIDVDEYYRLISNATSWRFCKHLKIASYIDRGDSITSSLGSEIPEIRKQELMYLLQKHPKASLWLNENRFNCFYEGFFWLIIRIFTRSYSYLLNKLGLYPLSKKIVRKAFSDYK